MARKILTQERLKELLNYDPATGVFTWLKPVNRYSMVKPGDRAGCLHKRGYIHIKVDGDCYKAHRLAWLYVHGRWPEPSIDHINRDKADNRLVNLRETDQLGNMQNKGAYRSNTSGYTGVSWNKQRNKWSAQIQFDGKLRGLGFFDDPAEAAVAYQRARTSLTSATADI
jgi:hypothetical protein